MMTVIKRSGKEEAFNIEKIKNTLAAASDELSRPLGQSDINNIAEDAKKRAENLKVERIAAKDLYRIVVDSMRAEGYSELADAYAGKGSRKG